ncbi:MAG: DUF1987 domain-containing protein [Cytophagaceae bacterium]|jgi:hypothetical protein|nr:DUF1987 domain-containing protein [Cytophagaceae bacterium]
MKTSDSSCSVEQTQAAKIEPPPLLTREPDTQRKTPEVYFNMQEGVLKISGRSLHENSLEYYAPLLHWLGEWVNIADKVTHPVTVSFYIEYFNTTSSKMLYEFMKKLVMLNLKGVDVTIKWYYEDDDMLEAGEDYRDLIKLPFTLIEYIQ